MKNKILVLLIFCLSSCAKQLCDIPPFKTKRVDYQGNGIKLSGIYYSSDKNSCFFLHHNGVLQVGCYDPAIASIPQRYQCSLDPKMVAARQDIPYAWGLYVVVGDSITTETYLDKANCEYETYFSQGKILNDSTLAIKGLLKLGKIDTFHFADFAPKPDSTNNFIK